MENKKKVISRGYTFEARSWENDGDHLQTKHHTVESEDEARLISKLCNELFPKLGNTMSGEGSRIILRFVDSNKELFETIEYPESYISDLAYSLMGGSDDYDYRVLEDFILTYSEEDIYLSIVQF